MLSTQRLAALLLLATVAQAGYFSAFDLPINDATATPDTAAAGFAYDSDYKWIVSWAIFFGFCAAYGIGANDVANAFATSVGSKALTVMQAVIIAAFCEFGGAVLLGSSVTDTVRKKIVDYKFFDLHPDLLMIGMLSVIIAVAIWLFLATTLELPVSTTHSCVGGVIGFALCTPGGVDNVAWNKVGLIVMSWFASPVLSGIMAAAIYLFTRKLILRTGARSFDRTLIFFPVLVGFTVAINCFFIMYKGGKGLGWNKFATSEADAKSKDYNYGAGAGLCIGVGLAVGALVQFLFNPIIRKKLADVSMDVEADSAADVENAIPADKLGDALADGDEGVVAVQAKPSAQDVGAPATNASNTASLSKLDHKIHDVAQKDAKVAAIHSNAEKFPLRTEGAFAYLQIFTAIFDSFSHGANDVANSIGPLAAVVAVYNTVSDSSGLSKKVDVETWVLAVGGAGIVVGLATYGYKMISALGVKLTKITPSRGFAIELGAAFIIVIGSILAIPLSTTHCQVGATCGVAMCDGWRNAINWKLIGKVIAGWVLTLVIVGTTAGAIFSFATYAPSINYPLSPGNCLTAYGSVAADNSTTLAGDIATGTFTTYVSGGDIMKNADGIFRNTGL